MIHWSGNLGLSVRRQLNEHDIPLRCLWYERSNRSNSNFLDHKHSRICISKARAFIRLFRYTLLSRWRIPWSDEAPSTLSFFAWCMFTVLLPSLFLWSRLERTLPGDFMALNNSLAYWRRDDALMDLDDTYVIDLACFDFPPIQPWFGICLAFPMPTNTECSQ